MDFLDTKTFDVTSAPSPFAVQNSVQKFVVGKSIDEIVSSLVPEAYKPYVHIHLGGHYINRDMWHMVKPKQDQRITLRAVPMGGGGGKNPLAVVLTIALIAVAPYAAGAVAGSLGTAVAGLDGVVALTTGIGGALVRGSVMLVGRMLINAIAPPPKPKSNASGSSTASDTPTLFIAGAGNRVVPFGTIPRALGKHRMVPPQLKPFTEIVGDDQYVRQLFIWGYGELDIEDIRIGDTAISEFTDVEIETVHGAVGDPDITLYTNDVDENNLSITLTEAGGYETRTTTVGVDEISVDVVLPRGLVEYDTQGNKKSLTIQVEVQYAPTGTSDWSSNVTSYTAIATQSFGVNTSSNYYQTDLIVLDRASGVAKRVKGIRNQVLGNALTPATPSDSILLACVTMFGSTIYSLVDKRDSALFGDEFQTSADFLVTNPSGVLLDIASGGLKHNGFKITAKQTSAVRKSLRFQVDNGQYDVRLRRITPDTDTDKIFDDTVWSVLRSISHSPPVSRSGMAMTAIRIKATDQLNGAIDQLNAVVTSILPDWNGTAWVDAPTSNPASLFRAVLQGSANARAVDDSRIDLTKLEAWHDDNVANNREYNRVVDGQISVQEMLGDVASAGRASPTITDGLWGVVQDKVKTVPIQHFTPRNSFEYAGEIVYPDQPHALRIQFINRDKGWQPDEVIVYDDGFDVNNATKFESLSLSGVTSSDQAWKDGRYHIAVARLRPEIHSFSVDVEHLVCTRGDLVKFTHDVSLTGISSGRVVSVTDDGTNATHVTLDTIVNMEALKTYNLRFRLPDGTSLLESVVTNAGDQTVIEFTTPVLLANAPIDGDLFMYGETNTESIDLIINKIIPASDLTARLICVDAANAIHDAENGTIPAFNSNITTPIELKRPDIPILANIQSGEEVLIRNADNTITSRIVITLNDVNQLPVEPIVLVKASSSNVFEQADFTGTSTSISVFGLEVGETYDFQIIYSRRINGMLSAPLIISNHRFSGDLNPPADVVNFNIDIQGQTLNLTWDSNTEYDISHYVIKFSNALTAVTWGTSLPLSSNVASTATLATFNSAIGTYLIKAVDFGGRESVNAVSITTNISELDNLNVISTVTESPTFSGVKTTLAVVGGNLVLANDANFDLVPNVDLVLNMDTLDEDIGSSGTYLFDSYFDLGTVYTSKLTAVISAFASDLAALFDDYADVDLIASMDGSADPSDWGVELQVRFTDDDPAVTPVWSAWQRFVIGDYTARAFEWKIIMTSNDISVRPEIETLSVVIDMPDRVVGEEDLLSNSGSVLSVTYPSGSFRVLPALAIAAQDMATGDYYTITNKAVSGFDIRFFNSSAVGIAKTFDYVAKGYGKVVL